ncbi:hypothetical protein D9M70_293920 [compost metagenome]
MRGGQAAASGQRDIHLRLAFPDVQHRFEVVAPLEQRAQRRVVDHRPAAGVDQPGAGPQAGQASGVEQVAGARVQRGVQADDVAFGEDLVEPDKLTALGGLPRRIADPHVPAEAAQHLDQPPADLAGADHAVAPRGEFGAPDLGQRQQAAEHVVDHSARIAAGRAGPGDAGLAEVVEVEMVGADGAGADEAHRAALQQGAVDLGHRAHQQHLGIGQRGAVDATPRQAADIAEAGEEGFDQGNVFVGKNAHRGLLSRRPF